MAENFPTKAREAVHDAYLTEYPDDEVFVDDFYVVWFSKTLQNWKALVSTDIRSGLYYEITHNGDKNETYVDSYIKTGNHVITIPNK